MRRDIYCTLIVFYPQLSHAVYFDSGSHDKAKDYTTIKMVLEEALTGFAAAHGPLKKPNARRGVNLIKHQTEFPCVKQPKNSTREAYYAIHHIREFVEDKLQLRLPASLRAYRPDLANAKDADLRQELLRVQAKISNIINCDVCKKEGLFYHPTPHPTNGEILDRLAMQGDHRPFMTLGGVRPFPPLSSQKK